MPRFSFIYTVEAYGYDFQPTSDGTHIHAKYWFDLELLDSRIVLPFRISVWQERDGLIAKVPKLHLYTVVEAENKNTAIQTGFDVAKNFLNHLTAEYGFVFVTKMDECIVAPYTASGDVDLQYVELLFNDSGGITAIRVIDPEPIEEEGERDPEEGRLHGARETRLQFSFITRIKNDDYVTTYGLVATPRGEDVKFDMADKHISKERLDALGISKQFEVGSLIDTALTLWSKALTTDDPALSFVYLFQVVDLVSAQGDRSALLSQHQLDEVGALLVAEGLPKNAVKERILNALKALPTETFDQLFKSGLAKTAPNAEYTDELRDAVRACRPLRGKYVHVRRHLQIHESDFYEVYMSLRAEIGKIVKSLRGAKICDDCS